MQFNACLYFPQWQGGPSPDGVRLGSRFLHNALKDRLDFHVLASDESSADTERDIRHYAPLLSNLKQCAGWLKERRPRTLFTLGGDCSIDIGPIDWLHSRYGKDFGLIWIDAHADIHAPQGSETKYFHGMPLRLLLGEGDAQMLAELSAPLSHRQICYAGIRSIDPPEAAYIAEHKLPVLMAADINKRDYGAFIRWREQSDIRHLHIHLDLDALDPLDGITVTYRVEGGIRLSAMAHFLRFLHGQGITVGFSLTEYAATAHNPEEIEKILRLASDIVPLAEVLAA